MSAPPTPRRLPHIAAVGVLAGGLMLPAILNRFPLIFPDSGTYLGIAFGHEYAIDRSSLYGFALKPFVTLVPSLSGLWLAIAAQCLLLAGLLWPVARLVTGTSRRAATVLAIVLLLTSLGWHAAQFMPDAFTGAVVLLGWLCARRDPGASGAPTLWLAAIAAASTHYTHVAVLAVTILATLTAERLMGLDRRAFWRRCGAALAAITIVVLGQISLNAAILRRPQMAPLAPLFLFARLNADGLMTPWLRQHCATHPTESLCVIAPRLPTNSQTLLWSGAATPITEWVWHPDAPERRWQLIDEISAANRGAIGARPAIFLANSLSGAARQFVTFAPLDDECPQGCYNLDSGIGFTLAKFRPDASAALQGSRQVTDANPKALLRAVIVPVAALGVILLPFLGALAWRRRDPDALGLVLAIGAALIVNAVLAGALSDVHDRYQSRIVWLAPLLAMLLMARWTRRAEPRAHPVTERRSP